MKIEIMKTNLLFPHSCSIVGWIMFVSGILFALVILITQFEPTWLTLRVPVLAGDELFGSDRTWFTTRVNNLADELASILFLVGGLMVAFSREKIEDEYIARIRLESLVWATYVNYGLLMLAILFIYDMSFYYVMLFNLFTLLIFFIIRFRLVLWSTKKAMTYEK